MRAGVLLGLCLAGCLAGCNADFSSVPTIDPALCDDDLTRVDASGIWTVSGSGARSQCSDERLNAESFALNATLPMSMDGEGKLALSGNPAPAGVDFSVIKGTVAGSCVSVSFREDDLRVTPAETIITTMVATVSAGTMRGSFTQDGPGDCEAKGTFIAAIQ